MVLLIEDSRDDALFLDRAFAKAGLGKIDRVIDDGQEAIEYFAGRGAFADRSAHPLPTHVLLDLKIPKVSGLEILEWIRKSEPLKQLPVAVLSSSGEKSDRERALRLGVDGYFIKPSRTVELLDVVRQIAVLWRLPAATPGAR